MKYVVSWETRAGLDEQGAARLLQVFGKWSPSEGNEYVEFLNKVDGNGGFAVITTDDPSLIAKDTAPFQSWLQFSVHPVLEIADSVAIDAGALEFLGSVS